MAKPMAQAASVTRTFTLSTWVFLNRTYSAITASYSLSITSCTWISVLLPAAIWQDSNVESCKIRPDDPDDAASATIDFTHVPAMNSHGDLEGVVTNVDPKTHNVAVYIFVQSAGGWWSKATWTTPLTRISEDNTWSTDITTGGDDETAESIAAFVLPVGVEPPRAAGLRNLPAELSELAVAQKIVHRVSLNKIS